MSLRSQTIAQQIVSFHQLAVDKLLLSNGGGNVQETADIEIVSDVLTSARVKVSNLGYGINSNGIKGDGLIVLGAAGAGGNTQGNFTNIRIIIPTDKQVNIKITAFGRSNPLGEYYTATLVYNYKNVGGVVTLEGAASITDQGLLKTNYGLALTLVSVSATEIGWRVDYTSARPAVEICVQQEIFITA